MSAKSIIRELALGFALAAGPTACRNSQAPANWVVTFEGIGPVKIGMSVPEAEGALAAKLTAVGPTPPSWSSESGRSPGTPSPVSNGPPDGDVSSDSEDCYYVENEGALPGLSVMVVDGRIGRIDVRASRYHTERGVALGTPEQEVKHLYPKVSVAPNKYDDANGASHDLTLTSPDGRRGMVFETDGKTVEEYRVGDLEPVGYVEGCL